MKSFLRERKDSVKQYSESVKVLYFILRRCVCMQLSRFLNELDEMAYITDVQTDELVFVNMTGKKILQLGDQNYKGKLCYQVLYGRNTPCEECPRALLHEDTYFVRKNEKSLDGNACVKKDKLIKYQGRLCQLEMQRFLKEESKKERNRDKLTNLLSVTEGKKLIEAYLQDANAKGGFLFLFDLNHFRNVNEQYGCYFGDVVLREFGEVILEQVADEDIVVRYEGDEILVFRKCISEKEAYRFGEEVCQQVQDLYRNERNQGILSCNVGMMASEVIEEYDALVRYAGDALECVKHSKEKNVLSYMDRNEEQLEKKREVNVKYYVGFGNREMRTREKKMLSFAKNLLEKSKSLKNAVCILLAKLGREYGLTRIVVLETDFDFLCYNVWFQWHAKGQKSVFPSVIYVEEECQSWFQKQLEEDGYFWLDSRVEPLRKKAFDFEFQQRTQLFCELHDQENYNGMVIFECEDEGSGWPIEICEMLHEISCLLAVYQRREKMNREMKEKADFLSGISHEIRTPMNAINGWTSIAKNYTDNKDKMEECLEKIYTSSQYLMSVMDEILDVENMEHGRVVLEKKEFSLTELLCEVEDLFCKQLKEASIRCRFVNTCVNNRYFGDRKHIQQILVHFLDYVTKNTEEDASVTLHAMENDIGRLCFLVESTGNYQKISEVNKLFECLEENNAAFDENVGDINFQLLIGIRYIRSMGGTVEFQKNESAWEISVSLPIELGEEVIAEKKDEDYNFAGKHLLLVEDNDLNVEVAQTLLEMVGFEVDVAENGKVAVEKFDQKEPGSYDAILMDIRMPIMDGLEATRRIRNLGKEDSRTISIVALSANAHDEDARKSIANGMNGHLAKPIEVDCLYSMLQQLIM